MRERGGTGFFCTSRKHKLQSLYIYIYFFFLDPSCCRVNLKTGQQRESNKGRSISFNNMTLIIRSRKFTT